MDNISALEEFGDYSYEELRLADYMQGNRGVQGRKWNQVSAMEEFTDYSFEELRLADYMQGNRGIQGRNGDHSFEELRLADYMQGNRDIQGCNRNQVSAMEEFRDYSFEELRLANYMQGNHGIQGRNPNQISEMEDPNYSFEELRLADYMQGNRGIQGRNRNQDIVHYVAPDSNFKFSKTPQNEEESWKPTVSLSPQPSQPLMSPVAATLQQMKKTTEGQSLVDIMGLQGVDREVLSFLAVQDVTRLAETCQALREQPLQWMLHSEILVRLLCPWELRQRILSSRSVTVTASSRLVEREITAPSVWQALKPILHNRPLKYSYGLKFTIKLHNQETVHCEVHFPNDVFCHQADVTVVPRGGMYGANIFQTKPATLNCRCESKGCCYGGTYRYYYLPTAPLSFAAQFYCNACLEYNIFCKLRKIAHHPASYVVWDQDNVRTKYQFDKRPRATLL